MKNNLLIDYQYFANINYYKKLIKFRYVIFEQYDDHKKRSFSNRCAIAGTNGRIDLSIPLEKGRSQKSKTKDVKISNAEKWQLRHWRSILSSYNNAPWFKHFSDDLAALYAEPYEYLIDWDLACLDWTRKILKLDFEYERSKEWLETVPPEMEDFRNSVIPGRADLEHPIQYQQVFEEKTGFIPDLSILDLLFCEGPKQTISLLGGPFKY